MNLQRLLVIATAFALFGSLFADDAHARRGQRWRGRSGKYCAGRNFPRPPACPVPKTKGGATMYAQPQLCQVMKQHKSSLFNIAYRSCQTNSRTRGADYHSAHLCGKAVDMNRNNPHFGAYHPGGTAPHYHYQTGSCF